MSESVALAIETSQRAGGVALRVGPGDAEVREIAIEPSRRHDDALMPTIAQLCRDAGVRPTDLKRIVVDIGPGGFTGLRIAIATVKALAETTGAIIAGVPGALVAAEAFGESDQQTESVLVASACKGTSFWLTHVGRRDGAWAIRGTPGLVESRHFDLSDASVLLADEHFPDEAAEIAAASGVRRVTPPFTATACLRAGDRLIEHGQSADPLSLAPIYPRPPEAVAKWRERQQGVTSRQDPGQPSP